MQEDFVRTKLTRPRSVNFLMEGRKKKELTSYYNTKEMFSKPEIIWTKMVKDIFVILQMFRCKLFVLTPFEKH